MRYPAVPGGAGRALPRGFAARDPAVSRMRHTLLAHTLLATGLAAVLGAAWPAPAKGDTNPFTGDPDAIADGKRLWAETGCYACHGKEAGGAVGPDLTDDQWVYRPTDATIFKAIAKGRKGTTMVGWSSSLSDEEIWKVIAYIRSLYRGDPGKVIW